MPAPRPTSEFAIEASHVTKRFPPTFRWFRREKSPRRALALDDVSIQVRAGEVFGLVGPNGAGKTTLIKILTSLLYPTSGTARVAGYDVVKEDHRVRKAVGLVTSNERSFYWRLTGRQNLEFFACLYDIPHRQIGRRVDELLDLLELTEHGDKRFDYYSTGMRQRMALARGLIASPQFLFMDEPTKGVDPIARARLERVIREGITDVSQPTILITSHNLDEIERLCDRVALVNRGRVVSMGTVDELRELVSATQRFRLEVRDVEERSLNNLASTCQATGPVEILARNGTAEMTIDFDRGSDGFSRLVRGIIEGGGDVMNCTRLEKTFDEVFQHLVPDDDQLDDEEVPA